MYNYHEMLKSIAVVRLRPACTQFWVLALH